jgi:hypothetical protein
MIRATKPSLTEYRKANSLCTVCGKPVSGTVLCIPCVEDRRAKARARDADRKANGICVSCGKRKASYGFVRCKPCRQKSYALNYDKAVPKCPYELKQEPREETFEWEDAEHAARFAAIKRVPVDRYDPVEVTTVCLSDIPVRRGRRK